MLALRVGVVMVAAEALPLAQPNVVGLMAVWLWCPALVLRLASSLMVGDPVLSLRLRSLDRWMRRAWPGVGVVSG